LAYGRRLLRRRQRFVTPSSFDGGLITLEQTLDVVITIGSVGGVLVWAAQCLAYIKYYHWLAKWKSGLPEYYDRDDEPKLRWQRKRPFLSSGQPLIAYVGLTMCLLIVFVFSTATWWNGKATPAKVTSAFAGVSANSFVPYTQLELELMNQTAWISFRRLCHPQDQAMADWPPCQYP
jgi:yeast amino acid transporter